MIPITVYLFLLLSSPFNKWPGSEYECSTYHRVIEFNDYLNAHGLRSTIRWSRGEGIAINILYIYTFMFLHIT